MDATALLYQRAVSILEASASAIGVGIRNATPHPLLSHIEKHASSLKLQQHFKPLYRELQQMGYDADLDLNGNFDLILLRPSKNKAQTLAWMASAMLQLRKDGQLLVCCANKHGARSYEKRLLELNGHISSASKSRCRVFSAKRTSDLDESLAESWIQEGAPRHISALNMQSQPGLFSWEKADSGTILLLSHLPEHMQGHGMDLCCGYGFLASHLLSSNPDIKHLFLVDADHQALDCASQNLETFSDMTSLHWLDATTEALPTPVDWIVCNPPFHDSHQQDMALGQAIIQSACKSLAPEGRLYLVANRHLPYEATVQKCLKHQRVITQERGYKIIEGIK
ncbi:MAG: methyltransferase [Mariprofundaceae bacterium]